MYIQYNIIYILYMYIYKCVYIYIYIYIYICMYVYICNICRDLYTCIYI